VKGFELSVLNGFGVVYIWFMVEEWCAIPVMHK
jgi:hypothetical protein